MSGERAEPVGDSDEVRRLRSEVDGLRAVVAAASAELARRTDEVTEQGIALDEARLEIARLEALLGSHDGGR